MDPRVATGRKDVLSPVLLLPEYLARRGVGHVHPVAAAAARTGQTARACIRGGWRRACSHLEAVEDLLRAHVGGHEGGRTGRGRLGLPLVLRHVLGLVVLLELLHRRVARWR